MLRTFRSVICSIALVILVAGCAPLPAGQSTVPQPEASDNQPTYSCPDIEAQDFAVSVETKPADPVVFMKSVGLGELLEGTCAYGFEGKGEDAFNGVAFFIIAPTEEAAAAYIHAAVQKAGDAGYSVNHAAAIGQSERDYGQNDAGDSFLVAWFANVKSGDGTLPDYSMKAIGLESGQSVIIGSVTLAG